LGGALATRLVVVWLLGAVAGVARPLLSELTVGKVVVEPAAEAPVVAVTALVERLPEVVVGAPADIWLGVVVRPFVAAALAPPVAEVVRLLFVAEPAGAPVAEVVRAAEAAAPWSFAAKTPRAVPEFLFPAPAALPNCPCKARRNPIPSRTVPMAMRTAPATPLPRALSWPMTGSSASCLA